jgi:ABC-2 type transport system permease protein
MAGGGMIANDEENGTLDLIQAHPISRSNLFFGRLLAIVGALAVILALSWLGIFLPVQVMDDVSLDLVDLLTPFLSMFAYLLLFVSLTLVLSLLLPSKRMASMVSGIIMVADFFLQGFGEINENLKPIADVLPLNFYQGQDWVDGLKVEWFLGLIAVAILFSLTAWWRFLRRDIRVGGEGSWQLPKFSFTRSKSSEKLETAEISGD